MQLALTNQQQQSPLFKQVAKCLPANLTHRSFIPSRRRFTPAFSGSHMPWIHPLQPSYALALSIYNGRGPWCCMHVTNREKSAGMAAWSTVGNLGGSSRAGRRKWLVRNREQRRHRQQLDTQVRLCMVAEVLVAHPAQVDGAAEHTRWHGRRGQIAANSRNKHAKREGQCCIVACWRWPANWQAVCRQGKCP
jgi:hypothetical protein